MKRTLVMVSILLFACGCANHKATSQAIQARANANIKNGTVKVYKRAGDYQQKDELSLRSQVGSDNAGTAQRAKQLAAVVANMDAIEKASVVITGNTAIVGIELAEELSNADLIKCKNEVEKTMKANDEGIDHVAVTAAEELVKRVSELAADGNKGEGPPA